MRLVHHVLIEHGVRIAQDECRGTFVLGRFALGLQGLASGSEEHAVELGFAIIGWDRETNAFEGASKDQSHLLCAAKQRSEAEIAISSPSPLSTAEQGHRFIGNLAVMDELFDLFEHLIAFGMVFWMDDGQSSLAWELDHLSDHYDRVALAPFIVSKSIVVSPERVLDRSFAPLTRGSVPKVLNRNHSHLSDQSLDAH